MDMSGHDHGPRGTGCGEDLAPYALGALPIEDARAFERHLGTCELCRADLETLRPVVDALSESPEPVDPPPELRRRLMAVVEQEAADRRRSAAERARAGERRWWQPRPLLALALACAVLVVGVGIGIGVGVNGDDTRDYRGTAPPGVDAHLQVEDDGGRLVLHGMEPPPPGKVMQVWLVRGKSGKPEPTDALFRPNRNGNASVAVPGEMDDVTRVMVSEEPEGGSPSPTTAPAVDFKLA
jgi:anti-sigma-K factor RskA